MPSCLQESGRFLFSSCLKGVHYSTVEFADPLSAIWRAWCCQGNPIDGVTGVFPFFVCLVVFLGGVGGRNDGTQISLPSNTWLCNIYYFSSKAWHEESGGTNDNTPKKLPVNKWIKPLADWNCIRIRQEHRWWCSTNSALQQGTMLASLLKFCFNYVLYQ